MRSSLKAKCQKKLKSDNGASVILALVGFLIVAFVAIAIVNAAILNARRTVEEKKEEVAYIATTEAARLIQDCIEGDFAYKRAEDDDESTLTGVDDKLGDSIKSMADSIAAGGGSQERDISFSYSGLEKIEGSLVGKMKMDSSYTISIDIWVESGKTDYPLTIIIPGEGQTIEEEIPGTGDENGNMEKRKVTYASWSGEGAYIIGKQKD
ncbi:hypothetical protein [Butyrivibrio sp. FC2001]|jgi:hypothetical protein|uniref:hypothetical protein n=1 Tax=Butyrivibrio sp. FC2001 TaxID=1280671 RepID=UPI0003FF3A42|nr:hypothetical protein [Butyrivibrio sp. FC2001]MCR5343355.1 hypothetical protein [Butyrivibrio sp.]